ncbi:hypothetical protein [Agromyces archimandritae]|uniref:Uncharacterized protein n=1 Tax=Agromyces archimandritae TaxID=2781962 RepID=A0A975IMD3_9MICO|nr:hypothetical protein [Agromyces archimandritae]QTX03353.1 hypothetical protein G127AT_08140 [Agromyces archimandritae]
MGKRSRTRSGVSPLVVLGWSGAAALLIGAFFGAFAILNQTVYGPASFVERYLTAIADDDILTAASTPGVALDTDELAELGLPADTSRAMLRDGVIEAGPEDISVTVGEAQGDGVYAVTANYRVGTEIVETTFHVKRIAPLYGVLSRWAFAESPLAVMNVTVQHGSFFTVGENGLTLDTRATKSGEELTAFTQSAPYLVVAPAAYSLDFDDPLLHADDVDAVAAPGERADVVLDVQATDAFVERVQTKLDEHLAACAEQHVLQPAECPFGTYIDDRVTSEPKWSIANSPVVTLTPGDGAFELAQTQGVAHLSVEVQSLYDGTIEQHEEDVPFTISLTARIKPDGNIVVSLR